MKDENCMNEEVSLSELMNLCEKYKPYKFPCEEYKIIGDTAEIDRIIHANGFINIGVGDVKSTLSKEAINYISTASAEGDGCVIGALKDAMARLPIKTESIAKLLIQIWMPRNMDSAMKEIAQMSELVSELSEDIDLCWGFAHGDLPKEIEVSIIAASK